MSLKVWIDGQLVDKENARISVYDHGLLYGDGVFEGIRVYNGKIFQRDAHVRRLYESAKSIRLTIPYSAEQLIDAMQETIAANAFTDCYIRLIVTRGVGCLGISPATCGRPGVICIADSIALYPRELYETGMAVITSSVTRNHSNSLSPRIKSLNYLNNILAKIEAIDAGVPEAIMLNHDGNVAECTGDNIFLVKDGQVRTPSLTDGILEGITRDVILELCGRLGIDCAQTQIQRHDLYTADECFLTGSAAEVIAVTRIDHRIVGNGDVGPVTRKLLEAFRRYVREA